MKKIPTVPVGWDWDAMLFPEWHPHRATWLAWPHRRELWSGHHAAIEERWIQIAALLSHSEQVHILIPQELQAQELQELRERFRRRGAQEESIFLHPIDTDDVWIRDYGPLWLTSGEGLLFEFDGWGKKYQPFDRDAEAGEKIVKLLGEKAHPAKLILEGGAIDTDGELLISVSACLKRRANQLTIRGYRQRLQELLQPAATLLLEHGLPGDDTDGHVDMITRFVAPRKVVTSVAKERSHPAFEQMKENRKALESFRDPAGQPLEVIPLPLPTAQYWEEAPLPCSYANFYIANRFILVPLYADEHDAEALQILQRLFPERDAVGIDARQMILEGGALHCMTLQQPCR